MCEGRQGYIPRGEEYHRHTVRIEVSNHIEIQRSRDGLLVEDENSHITWMYWPEAGHSKVRGLAQRGDYIGIFAATMIVKDK